jgi:Uma2 family endonuclease
VKNVLELPQTHLLSSAIEPILEKLHPNRDFCLMGDVGIYWRYTDPPLNGAVSPDWSLARYVTPLYKGAPRRSWVMWKEKVAPSIIIEFSSDNGDEERDTTPQEGKFWIYEQVIRPRWYAIIEAFHGFLEVYEHDGDKFVMMEPDAMGQYPISDLNLKLGLWEGQVRNHEGTWLRWYTTDGALLPTAEERAKQEAERARLAEERSKHEAERARLAEERSKQAAERADQAQKQRDKLAEKLRALGIDPNAV